MAGIERIHFFEEKPQWLGKNTNHSKRLILSLTIATIFTLGVVAFSSTSMAVAEDRISSTGGEIQADAEVGIQLAAEVGIQLAAVNCGADPQPIVAMVTTNGFNSGTATILVGDLTASGFTVRDLDVSGGIPECVTKLYISSEAFGNCLLTPFTAAQEATIVNWIGLEIRGLKEYGEEPALARHVPLTANLRGEIETLQAGLRREADQG